jgi:hypothetical protein
LPGVTDIAQTEQRAAPRISFVSLGCPKALVDSERILTRLRAEGYELARSHAGADAVIVNTCGFLDSAKAESLAAIGQAMNENGKGCCHVAVRRKRSVGASRIIKPLLRRPATCSWQQRESRGAFGPKSDGVGR